MITIKKTLCVDATAVLKDTLGTTISTTPIASGASADITAPDGTAENSDATYSVLVPSGGALVLPDTTYNIYVNAVLDQSFSVPSISTQTINITP